MFGYRIRLIKKKELRDISIFENVVNEIDINCDRLGKLLTLQEDLSDIDWVAVNTTVKRLRSLFDIYVNNTYSLPSNMAAIAQSLDNLSKMIHILQETFIDRYNEDLYANIVKRRLYEKFPIEELERMSPDEIQEYSRKAIYGLLFQQFKAVLDSLYYIQTTIVYDLMRITMGVDIYEDHKRQMKVSKSPTDMVIRYKMQTEGFNLFTEKEKLKND